MLRLVRGAALLVPFLFLASWNYAEASRDFCAGCHTVEPAAISAAESVHSAVPCLSCHHRSGLLGSITYYPTLLREAIDELTGLPVAGGVLQPRACETCHQATAQSVGHRDLTEPCTSCHRDVAHPIEPVDEQPHPSDYIRLHGRDAVLESASCAECHQTDFCSVCHVDAPYPHPDAWARQHGATAVERGTASCESCHPTQFCGGCHGGDVPHPDDWLAQHNQSDPETVFTCLTCHARDECGQCHARHLVHREQGLFEFEVEP